jgi:hypothetical protein
MLIEPTGSLGHTFRLIDPDNIDDWLAVRPGDMLVCSSSFNVCWPPDGTRTIGDNGMLIPRLLFKKIEAYSPFLVLSLRKKHTRLYDTWYRWMNVIIFVNNKSWWKGITASGSLGNA